MTTKTPLESFSPDLLAALLKGALEEVRLPMPYHKAVLFRRRLYTLRKTMNNMKHEKYPMVAKCEVRILWGQKVGLEAPKQPDLYNIRGVPRPADTNTPCIVILRPHDSEFTEILNKAGIKSDLEDDPLKGISEKKEHNPIADNFLSSFKPED